MVRTIVIPEDTHIELDVPTDYIGKKVEVNFFLLDEIEDKSVRPTMGQFWGILSDETANDIRNEIKKSRDEWDRGI
jgi:hypothetical protein